MHDQVGPIRPDKRLIIPAFFSKNNIPVFSL